MRDLVAQKQAISCRKLCICLFTIDPAPLALITSAAPSRRVSDLRFKAYPNTSVWVQAKADENLTNRNLLSSSCDRSYLVAISSSSVGAGLGSCISSMVVLSGRLRAEGRG